MRLRDLPDVMSATLRDIRSLSAAGMAETRRGLERAGHTPDEINRYFYHLPSNVMLSLESRLRHWWNDPKWREQLRNRRIDDAEQGFYDMYFADNRQPAYGMPQTARS